MASLRHRASGERKQSRARSIMAVAGTRPECIKLAPVMRALVARDIAPVVVNSGQHAAAVRATLHEFGVEAHVELAPLPALANLSQASQHLRTELRAAIARYAPAIVVVQGDTLTAHAGACAASDEGCPVAHVEAGLRTNRVHDPFPEEWLRRRIARHARWHFAPTIAAAAHLRAEGHAERAIHCVGNPGIDSLRAALEDAPPPSAWPHDRRRVLVTLHRRENYDRNADVICAALLELADCEPGLTVVVPVHPNPRVAARIRRRLGTHPAFRLVEPMPYKPFIRAAATAGLIVSDSGGIQEEAPHLGTFLLVPRGNTERPEALATGFVQLTPVDVRTIVMRARALLATPRPPAVPIDADAPFGDGHASERIASILAAALALQASREAHA